MTSATARTGQTVGRSANSGLTCPSKNVGETERWASVAGGGLLSVLGLSRGSLGGAAMAALGAGLVYRGVTGHCHMFSALGVSTAEEHGPNARVAAGEGVKFERSIDIDRPAGEIYQFWRELENIPKVMRHVRSVTTDGDRSHWEVSGPFGFTCEWDAEIITDRPNETIAWGSVPGGDVDTAGSVHFEDLPGRGTRVTVTLKYDPPAGKVGAAIARFFAQDPEREIDEDLQHFKEMMEANELTPTGAHVSRFSWPGR